MNAITSYMVVSSLMQMVLGLTQASTYLESMHSADADTYNLGIVITTIVSLLTSTAMANEKLFAWFRKNYTLVVFGDCVTFLLICGYSSYTDDAIVRWFLIGTVSVFFGCINTTFWEQVKQDNGSGRKLNAKMQSILGSGFVIGIAAAWLLGVVFHWHPTMVQGMLAQGTSAILESFALYWMLKHHMKQSA